MSRRQQTTTIQDRIATLIRDALGREVVRWQRLPGGLDTRRFFRCELEGSAPPTRLIARVEDPKRRTGADPPLEPIRSLLAREGLPVPASHGIAEGIDLIEDLGDESVESCLPQIDPARRRTLYSRACALIPRLQAIRPPSPALPHFQRGLDAALIGTKAQKWLTWSLPLQLGRTPTALEEKLVRRAFDFIAEVCAEAPSRLAHRDFKAANLHLKRGGREGSAELYMIDLQGAFMAPPEYDLVCLLRDSQVRLPEAEVIAQTEEILPQLPDSVGPETFARRFDLLTLARVAKDISHYLHAARHRGDQRYLRFVPNGLRNLREAAGRAGSRDTEIREFCQLLLASPERFPAGFAAHAEGISSCGQ